MPPATQPTPATIRIAPGSADTQRCPLWIGSHRPAQNACQRGKDHTMLNRTLLLAATLVATPAVWAFAAGVDDHPGAAASPHTGFSSGMTPNAGTASGTSDGTTDTGATSPGSSSGTSYGSSPGSSSRTSSASSGQLTGQTGPHGNGQVPPGGATVGPGSGNRDNRLGYSKGGDENSPTGKN